MIDLGREWPPNENRDVARYRNFYQVTKICITHFNLRRELHLILIAVCFQSWTGIVQGAYPVERKAAVRVSTCIGQKHCFLW